MKKLIFTGLATALITPMRGGKVDPEALKANMEQQAAGGAAAVLVCGSTGEGATLTQEERKELVCAAVEASGGRMAVIAGIGGGDTRLVKEAAQDVAYLGVNAVLAAAPSFNKTTQEGLYRHFCTIAEAAPAPVILYDVPSRTGLPIAPETFARLSRHGNIAAVKAASADLGAFQRARALCGDELTFYAGSDELAVPMLACGAKGLFSVASNLAPRAMAAICRLALEGDHPAASARYLRYSRLVELLFRAPNPIPVKAALAQMGLDTGELRLPLCRAEDALREELRCALGEVDLV